MSDVELHITLGVTVDRDRWMTVHLIGDSGLAADVAERIEQAVSDSPLAYLHHAITGVETLKAEEVSS
jgi:hypothetical protein